MKNEKIFPDMNSFNIFKKEKWNEKIFLENKN